MPSPNDSVFVCLQVETDCGVDQVSATERCYRGVINSTGEWKVGDTINIKLQYPGTQCLLVGWEKSKVTSSDVTVKTSKGALVSGTVSGLGTTQATFTLTGTADPGDTLSVCYRVGVPGVYVKLDEDRGDSDINIHAVDLTNPVTYREVYGRQHQWSGDPDLPDILRVTGMGLQTSPPS